VSLELTNPKNPDVTPAPNPKNPDVTPAPIAVIAKMSEVTGK
jgi:hypothetical protein